MLIKIYINSDFELLNIFKILINFFGINKKVYNIEKVVVLDLN